MRKRLVKFARMVAPYVLPEAYLYPLWRRYRINKTRAVFAKAELAKVIEIQPGVTLEVYWFDKSHGPGPVASLHVAGDEIMRLDCFGEHGLRGHYHINPTQVKLQYPLTGLLYFPPGSRKDDIERASFEIRHNIPAALAMSRDPRIRRVTIAPEKLDGAASEMHAAMLKLLETHRANATEVAPP